MDPKTLTVPLSSSLGTYGAGMFWMKLPRNKAFKNLFPEERCLTLRKHCYGCPCRGLFLPGCSPALCLSGLPQAAELCNLARITFCETNFSCWDTSQPVVGTNAFAMVISPFLPSPPPVCTPIKNFHTSQDLVRLSCCSLKSDSSIERWYVLQAGLHSPLSSNSGLLEVHQNQEYFAAFINVFWTTCSVAPNASYECKLLLLHLVFSPHRE